MKISIFNNGATTLRKINEKEISKFEYKIIKNC